MGKIIGESAEQWLKALVEGSLKDEPITSFRAVLQRRCVFEILRAEAAAEITIKKEVRSKTGKRSQGIPKKSRRNPKFADWVDANVKRGAHALDLELSLKSKQELIELIGQDHYSLTAIKDAIKKNKKRSG